MTSDDIPNASGIYKITCTANKKIYIGSALNLRNRKSVHLWELRKNTHPNIHLQRAWNKYGPDAFIYEVLELVLPMGLTAREQYWFNKLKPFGRNGFNIAHEAGSFFGMHHTPKTREKMRQSAIERNPPSPQAIEAARRVNLGKKWSPEQIEKRSQSRRGKKPTPETIEKLRQAQQARKSETIEKARQCLIAKYGKDYILTSPDGTEYAIRDLRSFCKDHTGITSPGLRGVARGRQNHHKGWKARYATTQDMEGKQQ